MPDGGGKGGCNVYVGGVRDRGCQDLTLDLGFADDRRRRVMCEAVAS